MPRPEWRDSAKEKYWRRILNQWRRSGLTGRAFCAAHGLSEPSFYAWRREIARRDWELSPSAPNLPAPSAQATAPAFVQVTLAPADPPAPPIEVILAHGRRVQVQPGFDAELLRQLLRVLEEPAC